jgi:hypothetical protein
MNEIKNNLRFMAHPKRAPKCLALAETGIEKVPKRAPGIPIGF